MKVLFLIRSLELGGAELQLLSLAHGCREGGHEVLIVTFYPGGQLRERADQARLQCVDLGRTGRWDLLGPVIRLRRLMKSFQADVTYSFLQGANVFAALLRPVLTTGALIWGVRASNTVFSFYGWTARAGLLAERLTWRAADLVVCNSNAGASFYHRHGVDETRIRVIPNGIDVETFRPDPIAGAAHRRQRNVPAGSRIIGVVGRLDPIKDHRSVLEACAELTLRGVDLRLWCVGHGTDEAIHALETHASALGLQSRLDWLGARQDMPVIYNSLDLLVSASLSEGFPNVVAEAAACGTPCVVTDVGDSALIVCDPSYIVPASQPSRLAEAMYGALHDPASTTTVWRSRVTDRFSRESVRQRTLAMLDDALRISMARRPGRLTK